MTSRLAFFLLFFVLLLAPATSRADDATAREHFKKGVDLYDKRQYEAALPEFRAAYAAKPSAGIKQNIGLCLKALGKRVEAARTFDEALDEGATTLKPETRAAIQRELGELSKQVATVDVHVISGDRAVEGAAIRVDGAKLPPGAEHRPIRLDPGIHTFDAHVDGFADPPQKKLSLEAGSPVDATFELAAGGTITIRPNVAEADVVIDGKTVSRGTWAGSLPPGKHHVEISAQGFLPVALDVDVANGSNIDMPITMRPPGEMPDEYNAPNRKPPPERKRFYVDGMLAFDGEIAHVPRPGVGGLDVHRQIMGGTTIGLEGGYRTSRLFALGLHADVGGLIDSQDVKTKMTHWQITPLARFNSDGKTTRFVAGVGLGVHGISVEESPGNAAGSAALGGTRKGSAVTASLLLDAGVQFDIGPAFIEPGAFFDWHGVGVRDDGTRDRMLEDSPGLRYGIRVAIGAGF
ncbi:MAG TPA: PEGA domain-containing protein [Labilithrix sp.]